MSAPIGQLAFRFSIINITNANPCEVTLSDEHGYTNKAFVRLTDLNGSIPIPRGDDQINNYKYRIIVNGTTTFTLQDPITFKPIDSTDYTPYVSGGSCNLVQTEFIYYPSEEQEYPN